ncbi:MAG: permease [bacterium]|nr:permease [bacterium]
MLKSTIDFFTYSFLKLSPDSHLGLMLNFFIYDTIKILFLLLIMITVMGVLRSYLPEEKVKAWIEKRKFWVYFGASAFGALTPFCSCSSIPLFFSFLKMGIPLGVTFSFLITSPIVNEYLVILMISFFGLKVALIYIASGIIIGVFSGFILGKMNLEKHLSLDFQAKACCSNEGEEHLSFNPKRESLIARLKFGLSEALLIIKKLWKWILLGVGLGAVIHNYLPQEFLESLMQKTGVFSIPLATLLGIPMYGSCAAIVPIAVALFNKGIPLGVALSFMMATSALSLPQAIMLKRAMNLKLIFIFFMITGVSIMLIGYLLNLI